MIRFKANTNVPVRFGTGTNDVKMNVEKIRYMEGGTADHAELTNRDAPNQHPISAIEGLEEALAGAGGGGIGEYVGGTTQTPYSIDQQSLEIVLQEPVVALEGAEILNCYGGDREDTGVQDMDRNVATGFMSLAAGYATQARGNYSQSRGWWTIADGQCSVAEGLLSRTEGHFCHAEGTRTRATINNAHSEGDMTQATGRQGHSEGQSTISSGFCSHAEGSATTSSGYYSHSEGWGTIAKGKNQTAMGKYNIADTSSLLIVGKGSKTTASNALTLSSAGNLWVAGTMTSTGADYAEYFEWLDGNPDGEDRVGLLVALEGDKIRLANEQDDIIGAISGTAAVLGDNAEHEWKDKYATDKYGRILYEMVEDEEEISYTDLVEDADGTMRLERKYEKVSHGKIPQSILNPSYDPEQVYVSRAERKEWDIVGMLGKLHITDDGTCKVGGYAKPRENGIATASDTKTGLRVMKRIAEDVVLVLAK